MKKLVLIFFALISLDCSAQVAAKLIYFCPTGDLGFAVKKKVGAELMYLKDFEDEDDRWRSRFGLSYLRLKMRLDTFPVYATLYDGTGSHILPGYEVYHKYNMGYLFSGFDFKVAETHDFVFYPGVDIIIGGIARDYDSYYATVSEGSDSGGSYFGGFRFRAGVNYNVGKHVRIFFEAERSIYLSTESGFLSHNDYGLGFLYSFAD